MIQASSPGADRVLVTVFSRLIVLTELRFQSSQLSLKAALVLRSFGEAHSRRARVTPRIYTDARAQATATHHREHPLNGEGALVSGFNNLGESQRHYCITFSYQDCV